MQAVNTGTRILPSIARGVNRNLHESEMNVSQSNISA
jgi:hypothetical protein